MQYQSTRGSAPSLGFEDVTLAGLASDGGLYLPTSWPAFSAEQIRALAGLSYVETAVRVMAPFVAGSLSEEELRDRLQLWALVGCFTFASLVTHTRRC